MPWKARPGVGLLAEEAARLAGKGGLLVFEAPTGYGKTRAGPLVYAEARGRAGLPRVIHALPLKAIVEEAYGHYREALGGSASVGVQAHGVPQAGKAPFYAPDAVVTTMDSFAFNLFRSSVGERGLGHYEVPRAHIASSLVVLDEAHLPLRDRAGPSTALLASLGALLRMRVPVIVETATLPPHHLATLLDFAGARTGETVVLRVDESLHSSRAVEGARVEYAGDGDYAEWARSTEWAYKPLDGGLAAAVDVAAEKAGAGLRVFLAADTVADAIEAYEALTGRGVRAALVHGRLTPRDREEAVKAAARASVVVGTSAVEAGVNLDADVVVTSVPVVKGLGGAREAAWDSVLQRLGRACRSPARGPCRVEVYFYGGRAREAAREMEGVNPRVPATYEHLLERLYPPRLDAARLRGLSQLGLGFTTHREAEAIHRELCTPFREDLLVPLALVDPGVGRGGLAEGAMEALEEGWYVVASLRDALRRGGRWLLRGEGGGYLALTIRREYRVEGGHGSTLEPRLEELRWLDCAAALRLGVAALLADRSKYRAGVGLP